MAAVKGTGKKGKKPAGRKDKMLADNRKAFYEFEILDRFEAGIELFGTEVKSMRFSAPSIKESYAEVKNDEMWLVNAHIPEHKQGNRFNHETRRPRKLLMHRKEINKLGAAVQRQGMTIVPLAMYFDPRGRVKVEIGLARGKKAHDKRETEKARDWERQKSRIMKEAG